MSVVWRAVGSCGGTGMPGPSITFRCPECRKLLAAPPSRVGTRVICPKCQSDLIVPEPSGGVGASAGSDAAERSTTPPTPIPQTPPSDPGSEPVFLPIAIEDDPFTLRPGSSSRSYRIPDRSAAPEPPSQGPSPTTTAPGRSVPGPSSASESSLPVGTVAVRIEPSDHEPERLATPRSRDVVLPRTAVVLWSFVMLLALVCAFAAGLLVGHFLWPTTPSPSAPAVPPDRPVPAEPSPAHDG